MAAGFVHRGAEWCASIAAGAVCAQGVLRRAHRLLCGVAGHSLMLAFRRDRLLLQCVDCGYESPGCEIGTPSARSATRRGWALATRPRHQTRTA
jgi:hypothetical protein